MLRHSLFNKKALRLDTESDFSFYPVKNRTVRSLFPRQATYAYTG